MHGKHCYIEIKVDGTVYTVLFLLEKNRLVDIEKKPSDMGPPGSFCVEY